MRQGLPTAGLGGRTAPRGSRGVLVLLGAIALLYFTREILIPFAFALILTFLLTPAVGLLEKLRSGRVVAVVTVVLVSIAVAGGAGWTIGNQLVDVVNQLPLYRQNIRAKVDAFRQPGSGQLGHAAQNVNQLIEELASAETAATPAASPPGPNQRKQAPAPVTPVPVRIVTPAVLGWAEIRDLGGPVVAPVGTALIVVVFAVFMLLKREDLRNRLLRLAGLSQLNLMTQALDEAAGRVSRYILRQFLVNASFGALFGFGLYWIGVPNPALWGVVAAILRVVPYVGTMAAAILPIALSLAVFEGWLKPMLVFLLITSLEVVIGNFIEPWLYSAHVGISSLALLVTSVLWTVLWGPAGLILSTPLTVCVVVLGRYVPQLSFLHILLGDEEALAPEAQLYQRLLAMDPIEAHLIVGQYLKGKTLVELYDSVFVPALTMAEQDRHKGAIDLVHEEFLFLSINEMITEFAEHQQDERISKAPDSQGQPGARILCVPVYDQADEITAAMLAQLLEKEGFPVLTFPSASTPFEEWFAAIQAGSQDIVCISALPPYAFTPARAMCKQVREKFPKLKIIVSVWGFSGDQQRAMARFERTPPDRLSTTLAGTVKQVQELVCPTLAECHSNV